MTLNHDFVQLCKHNRDGSYQTQQDRKKILKLIARQLHKLGFRHLRARSIKPKHVEALVEMWKEGNEWLGYKPVSDATIKNRMASVRWWSEKVQKQNVVPRTNQELGIGERTSARISRARTLDSTILNQLESPYVRMSLRLQAAFGLRREEAIKIRPAMADQGDQLFLKGSWTKGGRERYVPIRTSEQRSLLEEAKTLAGNGSLIPADKSYAEQLAIFCNQTRRGDIAQTHGLRHAYAQTRYLELTNRPSPVAGGPSVRSLPKTTIERDLEARLTIAEELGHSRVAIVKHYVGV